MGTDGELMQDFLPRHLDILSGESGDGSHQAFPYDEIGRGILRPPPTVAISDTEMKYL